MATLTSTKEKSAAAPAAAFATEPESIRRFAELLKLRTLAPSTQAESLRKRAEPRTGSG